MSLNLPQNTEARLLARLTPTASGCLEFTGTRRSEGYGVMAIGRGGPRVAAAHRVAWILTFGPIPDGMVVCHRCDNPPCCNPMHLFVGTRGDNNRDRTEKGRGTRGERVPSSRLTAAEVVQIRAAYASGASKKGLAREYGVNPDTIRALVTGRTWRHVPGVAS